MKTGDTVVITSTPQENYPYFKVSDEAILVGQDNHGDWLADFAGEWWYIQKGYSTCVLKEVSK